MTTDNPTTTAPLPDDLLSGKPKQQPCVWCGASRADQVNLSFSADDDTPLCGKCWESEYGEKSAYRAAEDAELNGTQAP